MTHTQTMVLLCFPGLTGIFPATSNEFVINIKDTSVLCYLGNGTVLIPIGGGY